MCSRDHFIPESFLSIKSDLFNGIYHYFLINAFNLCYLNILQTLNSYTLYRVCKRLAYADFSHYQQTSIASFDTSVTPPPPKKRVNTQVGNTPKRKSIITRRLIESTSQGTEHKSALEQTRMWRARPRISLEIWTV